ncbi:DUF5701 family protein [Yinghuangia aomiensis]
MSSSPRHALAAAVLTTTSRRRSEPAHHTRPHRSGHRGTAGHHRRRSQGHHQGGASGARVPVRYHPARSGSAHRTPSAIPRTRPPRLTGQPPAVGPHPPEPHRTTTPREATHDQHADSNQAPDPPRNAARDPARDAVRDTAGRAARGAVLFDAAAEFDRQAGTLSALGYPALAGLSDDAFAALVAPLRKAAVAHGDAAPTEGRLPFLLVVTRALVPIEDAMPLTKLDGKTKPGFVDRSFEPGALERFVAVEDVEIPGEKVYLLVDVDRGEEFCGAIPNDAMATIADRGRTLLTIEEGIAFVTQQPAAAREEQVLLPRRLAQRRPARAAVWRSDDKPKLGWCWAGNPHTWLGMASAGGRTGA